MKFVPSKRKRRGTVEDDLRIICTEQYPYSRSFVTSRGVPEEVAISNDDIL